MNLRRYIPTLLDNLIWILLLGVILLFSVLTHGFLTPVNLLNMLFNTAVLGIMVIGQSFTLISGNFDLSMESTLALCGLLGAWLIVPAHQPTFGSGLMWHPFAAIALLLLVGLAIGWLNGILITRFKMNNFVVTLSMMIALRGAMLIVNEGQTVYGTPSLFNWLGLGKIGPVPVPGIVLVTLFVMAHIVTQYTPFGRELFAVGSNKSAALASGVDPDKRVRQAYLISGFLAAFAGWMLAGRLTNVMSTMGKNLIFETFAAAVIGGISLKGGRGTMIGAFGGVLLMAAISSGLNLMEVDVFWIQSIRGLIILVAMLIDAQKVRYTAPTVVVKVATSSGSAGD